jgi:hypothetical protein
MKINSQLIWMAFLFGILGLTGCTTLNTAAKARGRGEQVIYKASFDEVWAAVPKAITNAGLQYVSVDNDKHMFLAKGGITGTSWGENVAIYVEKTEDGKTSVEVITMPNLIPNYTAQDWDGPIFIQLDKRFGRA